ncbi:MAG: FtsX-like permease family protein [Cytophagales bacterium]|nr:FtsX-like permease family protein [Cytophagales bacterium]
MAEHTPQPPGWLLNFFRRLCKPSYVEYIEGDLLEIHERQSRDHEQKANWSFAWNIIRFLRPRYLKGPEDVYPKSTYPMFKNHVKISFRNMRRQAAYSLINILGLTVGIASCLLIAIHINMELSYDDFYSDSDRTFYVTNGGKGRYTPARMVATLIQDYPEVESGTRLWKVNDYVVKIDGQTTKITNGLVADSTFFDVFPQEFLQGEPKTSLIAPNSMVITQTFAERHYKGQNPIGKVIEVEGDNYTITALVSDPPRLTSIPFEFIVSFPREWYVTTGYWTGNNYFSFVKLTRSEQEPIMEAKFVDFVRHNYAKEVAEDGENIEDYILERLEGGNPFFTLESLKDLHLHHPHLSLGKGGKFSDVLILGFIGVLILLIATINFINMTTARAGLRHKEVGVRKVLGTTRQDIMKQFLTESLMVVLTATILGFALAALSLPFFNSLTERSMMFSDIASQTGFTLVAILVVITTLLSGGYPAFYISSIGPVQALKGEGPKGSGAGVRKFLVIFQFVVSIFLIATTIIVDRQVKLMQNTDLGLETEEVLAISNMTAIAEKFDYFKSQVAQNASVQSVTLTNQRPGGGISNWGYEIISDNPSKHGPDHIFADEHYMDVLDLQMVDGRFFQPGRLADSMTVIVNQHFAKIIGENAVGTTLSRGRDRNFTVIGVVEDFYATTVKRRSRPLVIRYEDDVNGFVSVSSYALVRIKGDFLSTVKAIEAQWQEVAGDYPFEAVFLNDAFNRLYENEERFGSMFKLFSILAIFIASLGLLSLAAYVLERRYKEIAIRKVLGASSERITSLILRDFAVMVIIAAVIASPIAYFYGNDWLQEFAKRIEIDWMLLVIPVVTVLLFTLLLVVVQSYRAASANPVHALKQE